jgi:hypothetical protein
MARRSWRMILSRRYVRDSQGYGRDRRADTRNEGCFVGRRYRSRKGEVAPGNPKLEPELTPRRLVPLRQVRSIRGPFFTAGRPSFGNRPAGGALAQNNRNCGEISVPHGLSLRTIVVSRVATSSLVEAEHHCRRVFASLDRSRSRIAQEWFDFCVLFNLIAL